MRIRSAAVLAFAALAAGAPAEEPKPIPETLEGISNYRVVRPGLATAGQPSPETLAEIGSLGFRTVVNLRRDGEPGTENEAEIVERQGLRYVHVPISSSEMSLDEVAAVASVLDDPEAGPVLLHCGSANRVGGVWALIRHQRGTPLAEAIAEGREIGMRDGPVLEAVERLAGEIGKAAPPQSRK